MKKFFLLSLLSLFLFSFDRSENCEAMYSNATYGVMHSKKAFNARNFDDQRYFAKKALVAYTRVLKSLDNCGCSTLLYQVEDAMADLESAIEPYDWDEGRYYSKKVYLNSLELVSDLDEITDQAEEQ